MTDESKSTVKVNFSYLPKLNFALQQNNIKLVRTLSVQNLTDTDLQQVVLKIHPNDAFAPDATQSVQQIGAGQAVKFADDLLKPDAAFIAQLTEQLTSGMELTVTANGEEVFRQSYPLTVLTFNEWAGCGEEPAMLAAFVTPNSAALTPIMHRTSEILKEWTGSSNLSGYQTKDVNYIRKMAGAAYEALREQHIIYANPPASFEKDGQRIRLADEVLNTRIGTCIDTAVLYASLLEQIGLFPLLILKKGHCYLALWLISETLPDSFTEDSALLSKHLGLKNLLMVETTCLTDTSSADFDNACTQAEETFARTDEFICAIDVAGARFAGIHPLPQRVQENGKWKIDAKSQEEALHTEPKKVDRYEIITDQKDKATRQNTWEHKLLDLSLRNTLLNFRFTQKSMSLSISKISELEDMLSEGKEFTILPQKGRKQNADGDATDEKVKGYQAITDNAAAEFYAQEMKMGRLYSQLNESDNKQVQTKLYRDARSAMEESGANTLYIAIGLVEWYESGVKTPHYAPLLLVPIEMVRRANSYILRGKDEDSMLNVTLMELFRQNFEININGLNPLPTDEHGLDVNQIMAIVRQALLPKSNWNVLDTAVISNFSFSKFIMWNDIHCNMDALRKNNIINSLMEGHLTWDATDDMMGAQEMDHEISPSELCLPVSSDSSQLEAVHAAASGKSFILHGAPGTGKSQTITNIIANALYHGQRVLFAAEKMAALQVVQHRLNSIGIGDFCLECHSNKASKAEITAQLQKATEVAHIAEPKEFALRAQELFDKRKELNAYVDILHRPEKCGLSLYDAIVRYSQLKTDKKEEDIPFGSELINSITPEQLDHWKELTDKAADVAKSCGNPATHALRYLFYAQQTPGMAEQITQLIGQETEELKALQAGADAARQTLQLPPLKNREQLDALTQIAQVLSSLTNLPAGLLTQPAIEQNSPAVMTLIEHGLAQTTAAETLKERYENGVLSLPAAQLRNKWKAAEDKFILFKLIDQNSVKKQLKAYTQNGEVQLPQDLDTLLTYQNEKAQIEGQQGLLSLFGTHATATAADWQDLKLIQEQMLVLHQALAQLVQTPAEISAAKKGLADQLSEGLSTYLQMSGQCFVQLAQQQKQLSQTQEQLQILAGLDPNATEPTQEEAGYTTARQALLQNIGSHIDQLKDRTIYLEVRQQVMEAQLKDFVNFIESHEIPAEHWNTLCQCGIYRCLATYIIEREPLLVNFKGDLYESTICKFREVNAKYKELVQAELYARLAAQVPNMTVMASKSSEVNILQRFIQSKGRGQSLRSLMDQIPTLLSKLTPCMLMSPMSAAQYLDVNKQAQFDLVIFDEASQMPTSEAVGVIARGKNVIVVGDPKQMPPTSFFSSTQSEEEDSSLNDMESILDDCLALSIPSKHLLWHYRSKHESLIAFSNSQYYDNKLLTFPSPDNRVSKVTFVKVEGCYDKGKTCQNRAEADAIVAEVVKRLSDPEMQKKSIGIVTFSKVQQNLIEDLLTERLATDAQLDNLAFGGDEPLFVKNLENVQGDERDVILFSVCYGPDANGYVSLNFGPLNQTGGGRRLNVAVSRSRYEMKVFSTLTPDKIDLNRTNAEGVKDLKEFLEFAQKGTFRLNAGESNTQEKENLSTSMAAEIKKMGYDTDVQIGKSGFKIDVGVIDPKDEGRYILGILCDGYTYRDAQTARDREICQPAILSNLGWRICKVWAADWWERPDYVLKTLRKNIEDAINNRPSKKADNVLIPEKKVDITHFAAAPVNNDTFGGIKKVNYQRAVLTERDGGLEAFAQPKNVYTVLKQIIQIIDTESPVKQNQITTEIMHSWGLTRQSARSNAIFDCAFACFCRSDSNKKLENQKEKKSQPAPDPELEGLAGITIQISENEDEGKVYWKEDMKSSEYSEFRVDSDRAITDVPFREIGNAMRYVLAQQLSQTAEDLIKAALRELGFSRVNVTGEAMGHKSIERLIEDKIVEEKDGKISLL